MAIGEPKSDRFEGALRFRRASTRFQERSPGASQDAPKAGEKKPARSLFAAAFERFALIFAIMIYAGVGLVGQDPIPALMQESNPINLYANVFLLLMFGLLTLVNLKKTADFLPYSQLLLLLVALAFFSALWSLLPGVTIRRAGTLATTLIVAIYFTSRFDFAKAVAIIGEGVMVLVGLSLLAVFLMPHLGVTQPSAEGTDIDIVGTWKGILPHKNSLGWVCTAGVQVYAWRFLVEPERRLRHAACVALCIFVAAGTRSSTALITIVLSLLLTFVLSTRSRRGIGQAALEWGVVTALALTVVAVVLSPDQVLAIIGKSADMTGRIPLWRDLMVSIQQHPLLGYGYGTFWVDQNPERARIWALNPWQPPDAHNAYIEITLQLGLIGLAVATLLVFIAVKRALDWCKDPDAKWAVYVGCFLIVYLFTNVDETQLFRGGDFHCFVTAFCYFTLLRRKQARHAAANAPARDALPGTLDRPGARPPFRL